MDAQEEQGVIKDLIDEIVSLAVQDEVSITAKEENRSVKEEEIIEEEGVLGNENSDKNNTTQMDSVHDDKDQTIEREGLDLKLEDLAVAVVGFHHKRGNVVEAVVPNSLEQSDELAFGALPDGAHHSSELEAWCYLSVSRSEGSWYGATRIWQRLGEGENYESRGHVQQALCLLCTRPLYAGARRLLLTQDLESLLLDPPETSSKMSMLEAARSACLQALTTSCLKDDRNDQSTGCGTLCRRLGAASVWRLIKTMLLERSVVFAADEVKYSLSAASEAALALANFVPGFIEATCKSENSTDSIVDTTIPEQLASQNLLGIEYLGAVLGERAVLRPNVSLAHLNGGSLASSERPGRLVVCGCSNSHLASQLAPRHARSSAAALVTIPAREKHYFSTALRSTKTFSDDGVTENAEPTTSQASKDEEKTDTIESKEESTVSRGQTSPIPAAVLLSRTLTSTAGQFLSSSSPLSAATETRAHIRYCSPSTSSASSSSKSKMATSTEGGQTNDDPMSGDWRPTRSERELLDAIDDALDKEEHLQLYCREAFVHLLSQMLADVAATEPTTESCEALADRWDGKFLYAWLSGTRSGAEWASVFAPQWAEVLARRRDLAELLIPTLTARLARGAAGAAEQLNRTADAIGAAAKPRAAWVASAASKSFQASLQALDQVEGAATKTWQAVTTKAPQQHGTANDIVGSAASLVASFGDVVSGAATKARAGGSGLASRWGTNLKTAFASATGTSVNDISQASSPENAPSSDPALGQTEQEQNEEPPLINTQPEPAFGTPPPPGPQPPAPVELSDSLTDSSTTTISPSPA